MLEYACMQFLVAEILEYECMHFLFGSKIILSMNISKFSKKQKCMYVI